MKEGIIMADIESIVKTILAKLNADSELLDSFKKDPVKTIKEKLGISVSEDQIQSVISAVMAKLGTESTAAKGFLAKLKKLFGK